jgi:phage-related protein (TIGR01555 family)
MTTDGMPDQPIEPYPTIRCLDVYDRRQVDRAQIETDPRKPNYGKPASFRITTISGSVVEVHRSRCVVFGGALTGRFERQVNGGWDDSVLEVVIATVRAFNSGFLSLDNMLTDASTGVLKMAGVISSLGSSEGKAILETRAALFDLMRNVTRSLFLDAEENESYEKIATNFTGVPEAIDRLGQRLAAATGIPLTKLVGVSSNGLGATGEGDRLNWIDDVTAYRSHEIEPLLATLVGYIAPGHTICWPPLWQPTAKEAAELRKLRADTAGVYVQNEILRPAALTASAAADLGLPEQIPPEPEPEPAQEQEVPQ